MELSISPIQFGSFCYAIHIRHFSNLWELKFWQIWQRSGEHQRDTYILADGSHCWPQVTGSKKAWKAWKKRIETRSSTEAGRVTLVKKHIYHRYKDTHTVLIVSMGGGIWAFGNKPTNSIITAPDPYKNTHTSSGSLQGPPCASCAWREGAVKWPQMDPKLHRLAPLLTTQPSGSKWPWSHAGAWA